MLNPEDRDAIEGLFERIGNVERAGGPRDVEAETLIREKLRMAPAAPYYMAQTILVQEHALRLAEQRIAELEGEAERRPAGGGFLGGLFGDNEPVRSRQPVRSGGRGPWDRQDDRDDRIGRGGGGFLAGAAQTALGVTGGLLIGSAIASMLGGEAQAEEYQPDHGAEEPAEDYDAGGDDSGDFDMGGDF
jgi:uncharacterized protein